MCDLVIEFYRSPKPGEAYNMGGGRANSLSILETIDRLRTMGFELEPEYRDANRTGDHICYISDLTKLHRDFPGWKLNYDLDRILSEIVEAKLQAKRADASVRAAR